MSETQYVCIGLCEADPESGICLGCGRPPAVDTPPVAEPATEAASSSEVRLPEAVVPPA